VVQPVEQHLPRAPFARGRRREVRGHGDLLGGLEGQIGVFDKKRDTAAQPGGEWFAVGEQPPQPGGGLDGPAHHCRVGVDGGALIGGMGQKQPERAHVVGDVHAHIERGEHAVGPDFAPGLSADHCGHLPVVAVARRIRWRDGVVHADEGLLQIVGLLLAGAGGA
jgi:hypothetical protein